MKNNKAIGIGLILLGVVVWQRNKKKGIVTPILDRK
jgi:hypothetical protein